MSNDVYTRALQRAVELRGGTPQLASFLSVPHTRLLLWLQGKATIPSVVIEKVLDLLLTADVSSASAPRVLVVDDDPAGAYGLARLLKSMGYPVEIALDAASAIATAQRVQPQVVFIDLRMPDMDGCELAERLRQEPFKPRIFAATAYGGEEDRRRTSAAGFEAHLIKPIDARTLELLLPRLN
jgi:CheY-like chemotaxis protein